MTTWSNALNFGVTLSGANLIATTSSTANAAAFGSTNSNTKPSGANGKVAFLLTVTTETSIFGGFGMANGSYDGSAGGALGQDTNGWSFRLGSNFGDGGKAFVNNTNSTFSIVPDGNFQTGDIINIAVDLSLLPSRMLVWGKLWRSSAWVTADWNNTSGAVPGDNNGYDVIGAGLSATGPYYICWGQTATTGDACTIGPNPTTWSDGTSFQSGFVAWDSSGGGGGGGPSSIYFDNIF